MIVLPVAQKVRNIVAIQMNIKVEDVNDETVITDDLGADSLDLIELCLAIEDEFCGIIPEEDGEKLKTVGDIIRYVEGKIADTSVDHAKQWRK
jgi:acyl carrier protein